MQTLEVFDKKDFRKWLRKNHDKETRVALVIHKKHTGKPFPTHRELIEEAICYGWIDTTIKRIDEDTYIRHFSRRTKASTWSDNTLRYGKELIASSRMKKSGLYFYELGRKKPVHDDGIPKNPDMPPELRTALAKNKKAKDGFANFPPSTKKMLYRWILSGKRPETRKKRVNSIVADARAGNKNVALKTN